MKKLSPFTKTLDFGSLSSSRSISKTPNRETSKSPSVTKMPRISEANQTPRKETISLYKENLKLKNENICLIEVIKRAREEITYKDEFLSVINLISEENFDERKLLLYKAKMRKQDRLIMLLQAALDSQKSLSFEIENMVSKIYLMIKHSERHEETLLSISTLIKSARKKQQSIHKDTKVAYTQYLNRITVRSTKIEVESPS